MAYGHIYRGGLDITARVSASLCFSTCGFAIELEKERVGGSTMEVYYIGDVWYMGSCGVCVVGFLNTVISESFV